MLTRARRYVALVVIAGALALAAGRPAAVVAYTTQNPRWEAPGRGSHVPGKKPYKPLRQPPESMPARQHRARPDSEVWTCFLVFAPLAIVFVVSAAEWLVANWIAIPKRQRTVRA